MLETLRFAGAYPFEVWTFRAESKVSRVARGRVLQGLSGVGSLLADLPAISTIR